MTHTFAAFATIAGLAVLAPSLRAQAPGGVPRDDQKGRYLNFEVGPVRSVLVDAAHDQVLALDQPGNRLVALDPVTLAIRYQIPIALGAASMALRPGTEEVWIVDRVYASIQVVDLALRTITRTIRVDAEPHGLTFSMDGRRAWVSCTGADTVVAIDARYYQVVQSIPIPADAPRGITWHRGKVWVASHLSGNGTAARGVVGEPNHAIDVGSTARGVFSPMPDLDLFGIVPGAGAGPDVLDPLQTRAAIGTILFDVVARPGKSEVWIPGTEALNDEHRGEISFIAGQVVSNRITIVDVDSNAPPRIVDLDALAPPNVGCAQPTSLAFDPVRSRAYVCAYGSDLVAVLDIGDTGVVTWAGHIMVPAKQEYPRGSGPRSCAVDAAGETLYVFNRNDQSVARVNLTQLPTATPFAVTAPTPVAAGWDPSNSEILLGRHLFTDARNSASKTSSCASCHVDGNTDALAWDLSHYLEPEGTPLGQTLLGLDVKGPLVTQGTRRQEESGPYHWRGEKRTLNDFNASFMTLLDRTDANGQKRDVGPDFQYTVHYLNRMAIPANPLQERDRSLTPEQAAGLDLFQHRPLAGGMKCITCHALPLGSNGEVAVSAAPGVSTSFDVPGLRRVADREQQEQVVGGAFGTRPTRNAGLTHAGVHGRLEDVFARAPTGPTDTHAFQLSPSEAAQIAAFLRAFDTGLAPATAVMVTAHAGNWAAVLDGDLAFLQREARKKNCELVAFRTAPVGVPSFVASAQYDPARDTFVLAGGPVPEVSARVLLGDAAAGRPVTFLGVPLGMGKPIGLDRDLDGLMNADELPLGLDPEQDDEDDDRFTDGYEVLWGNDPFVPNTTIADNTAPFLAGPVRVIYATSNTIKFEFDTTEYCRVYVALNGGPPIQRIPLGQKGDWNHWCIVGGLQPDTEYVIDLAMRDSGLNIRTDSTTRIRTAPRTQVQPSYVTAIRSQVVPAGPTYIADVDVRVAAAPVGAGYVVRGSVYRHELGQLLPTLVTTSAEAVTDAAGTAQVRVPMVGISQLPGRIYFVLNDVVPPTGGVPYVRAFSTKVFDSILY